MKLSDIIPQNNADSGVDRATARLRNWPFKEQNQVAIDPQSAICSPEATNYYVPLPPYVPYARIGSARLSAVLGIFL